MGSSSPGVAGDRARSVLYISYVFPPMPAGGAIRTGEVVRYLPRHGWKPTVLTVALPKGTGVDDEGVRRLPAEIEVLRARSLDPAVGVRNLKFGGGGGRKGLNDWIRSVGSLALIPDRQLLWIPGALRKARKWARDNRPDLILATYGPASALLLGAMLKGRLQIPLVVEYRDLWTDNPNVTLPTPLHRAAEERMERWVLSKADGVIPVSDEMGAVLRERHPLLDAVRSIPNGYDPELPVPEWRPRPPDGPFRLRYFGSLYKQRDVSVLFRTLACMRDAGEIGRENFRLEVYGNLAASATNRFGVDDLCEIRTYVPHGKALEAMAEADALLLVEEEYVSRYGHAAKLFDYLRVERPVLALTAGWGKSARLIDETGGGVVVEPGEAEDLRSALTGLIRDKREGICRRLADPRPLERYDRSRLTEDLAEFLDHVRMGNPT